jgi:hypothetical protein
VSDKRFRPPSAYKHGGFSKTVLFPWEDADEFDDLHRSLREEWEPSGALEEDAVYTILTCIWRKRRIRDKRNLDTLAALQRKDLEALSEMPPPFFDTKLETTIYVLKHRPNSGGRPRLEGKVSHLIGFSSSLYGSLDGQFLEMMMNMLGGDVLFEACSAFTRVAACTLALPPIRDTLIEGFSHFVTSMTAPIGRRWSRWKSCCSVATRKSLTPTSRTTLA